MFLKTQKTEIFKKMIFLNISLKAQKTAETNWFIIYEFFKGPDTMQKNFC